MIFNVANYSYSFTDHNNQSVICIHFANDIKLRNALKERIKIYWSQSMKLWYCKDMPQYRTVLNLPQKEIGLALESQFSKENLLAFQKYRQMLILKGYSINTQKVYLIEFSQLLAILKNHAVASLTEERLKAYIYYCHKTLKLKERTIHSRINAILFYFEKVLNRPKMDLDIPRPKKPSTLPKVLSKKDLAKMFEKTENIKHRLILLLVYGMGLRVSEIVGLKIEDVDSGRMMVHLRQAKGKKDRYVPLPQSVLELLREYYVAYKPKEYLFEGMTGGQYTIRSAQAVFKQAMNRAGINKKVGIHGLRHSYATHLLESGIDISFIQKLLGHKDIRTTLQYAKISDSNIARITSPLDDIMRKKKV